MDDTGVAPTTSTGEISDPDLKLQAIERLLLLAQRYITVVEVSAIQYTVYNYLECRLPCLEHMIVHGRMYM